MKIVLLFLFLILVLSSISNDYLEYKAQNAYQSRNYKKALKLYSQIEPKNNNIYYNIANTLYKLKDYTKAIEYYKLIRADNLTAKKLYNIGNAYVMQKNYLKAIIFYRNALKFEENPKFKENLDYAIRHMNAMQDIMLSNAKCSTTQAELDNFDDQNISKDMQDAKYKPEDKFNVIDNLDEKIADLISIDINNSDNNISKVLKIQQKLINNRAQNRLKERSSKVLLIPIEVNNTQ